ncbi:hypothetical protein ACQ4PT_001527 [Festuca glaucescens]
MVPVHRHEGEPPPDFGGNNNIFTIMMYHGGFFVGDEKNRGYVDEKAAWFDYYDVNAQSIAAINDIVEQVGYEAGGRVRLYWCLPGKILGDPGALRFIWQEHDAAAIASSVKAGNNFVVIYIDHDETLGAFDLDDVAAYAPGDLPPVYVSPHKVEQQQEQGGNVEDEDYQPELVDSDFDISRDDDDLLEDQLMADVKKKCRDVDIGLKEKGKQLVEDLDEDVQLQEPDLDDEAVKYNFLAFGEEDMANPTFRTRQTFASIKILRQAIKEYSCKERRKISMPKNDKTRITTICLGNADVKDRAPCPWCLKASYDCRAKAIAVKSYQAEHTCSRKWKVNAFTSTFLVDKYIESFRADDKMSLKNFYRTVQKEWNMTPSRAQLGRAKRAAMKKIHGDEVEQYNLLWDYAAELRRSNPSSSFFLNVDGCGRFSSCYFSFDASKRGFLARCSSFECLDGAHLKTKFGGILLTAIGMDPNDCIFPVAFAVVEVEDTSTWKWFLSTLKEDLSIVNTSSWTIMSDKQKGLINAVTSLFPDSGHRFCVRHMYQNFREKFRGEILKQQLWKCARSTTVVHWQEAMEEMRLLNSEAHAWLEELDPKTCTRAFQSELPKCDILLNNNCEVLNKYILEGRELPVISMIEKVKQQITLRNYNKRQEELKWETGLCPKIMKKLSKNVEFSSICEVVPSDAGIFDVECRGKHYMPTTMPAASVIASLINESQVQQSQTVTPQAPLPECEFIATQVDLSTQRPMPPSQAQVAEATRLAKQKALAEKKEAEQMKKLEQAEKIAHEAELKKQA